LQNDSLVCKIVQRALASAVIRFGYLSNVFCNWALRHQLSHKGFTFSHTIDHSQISRLANGGSAKPQPTTEFTQVRLQWRDPLESGKVPVCVSNPAQDKDLSGFECLRVVQLEIHQDRSRKYRLLEFVKLFGWVGRTCYPILVLNALVDLLAVGLRFFLVVSGEGGARGHNSVVGGQNPQSLCKVVTVPFLVLRGQGTRAHWPMHCLRRLVLSCDMPCLPRCLGTAQYSHWTEPTEVEGGTSISRNQRDLRIRTRLSTNWPGIPAEMPIFRPALFSDRI
jgi:hypothetical protein